MAAVATALTIDMESKTQQAACAPPGAIKAAAAAEATQSFFDVEITAVVLQLDGIRFKGNLLAWCKSRDPTKWTAQELRGQQLRARQCCLSDLSSQPPRCP